MTLKPAKTQACPSARILSTRTHGIASFLAAEQKKTEILYLPSTLTSFYSSPLSSPLVCHPNLVLD
jgi:hypothetical protein